MKSLSMDAKVAKPKNVPFSLQDAPSLIERIWPAQKISVEAQKERKAVKGQTLTGLGSFWKGRKPLFLVRACILGGLLPSTGDDEKDLEIFDILCGMAADQIPDRFKVPLGASEVVTFGTAAQRDALLEEVEHGEPKLKKLSKDRRDELMSSIIARMPYQKRVEKLLRPEEVPEKTLTQSRMQEVNDHLGTSATDLTGLIEQLGVMRFGKRPCVGDTFCGGGSIPFEAARIGCDVYASDLNPIACMLTWGALNIIGASAARRAEIAKAQAKTIAAVDKELIKLGIEHDENGNRAKAYLYCVETRCPQTQWMVPLSPSWIISKSRKVVAVLVPDKAKKRYDIEIRADVSDAAMAEAANGTIQKGRLVHTVDGEIYSTPIKTIRGDRKGPNGETLNNLRQWEKSDFEPRADDIFQERLYCVQWFTKDSLDKPRKKTFFAGITKADLAREEIVRSLVRRKLEAWQEEGLIPDMVIEPGEKTDEPIRTRGWTYWHHLFTPRDYIVISSVIRNCSDAAVATAIPSLLNHASKLCQWATTTAPLDADGNQAGGARDLPNHVFYNQAFNTFWNYASRGSMFLLRDLAITDEVPSYPISSSARVVSKSANQLDSESEIFITDPPYADAVHYHEISEFFIPWLRKKPPAPFAKWTWDSRRALAIKGDGEEFRHNMVEAYRTMADHMPENGLQIVMFTHQSSTVWADMAQIFWGAGLQVMAAWYIATETTSELKKGGYVQGTVILVARKRRARESGYKDEIVQEVRSEVADQIDTMAGLNQHLRGHGRIENLFEDADLQMAGYAAALRVLTKYEKIDGTDMTKEALRPRRAGEKHLVGEIIDFAVQVANEHMVPEHMTPKLWEGFSGAERFYFKMMDIETTSLRKLDNYQNFAKAFRVNDYGSLMGSMEPNKARLRTAKEFKKNGFEIPEFGPSITRAALYGIFELEKDIEGDDVLSHLKDLLPNYHNKRDDLAAIAEYIARKREVVDETESRAARILHGLIRNERLG
jgi:putative DNA methylase